MLFQNNYVQCCYITYISGFYHTKYSSVLIQCNMAELWWFSQKKEYIQKHPTCVVGFVHSYKNGICIKC